MGYILPLPALEAVDLVLEPVCHHCEIGDTVRAFKYPNDTGIVGGVGVRNINYLYTQFKCSTTLVPPYLDPDLILWYSPSMPSQPATSVENTNVAVIMR